MSSKILTRSRKMSEPKDTIVYKKDDTVTLTYSLKVSKKDFGADIDDPAWKDRIWAALKSLENIDDVIVIAPGEHTNASFVSFAKTTMIDVHLAILGEALTTAMLSKHYEKSM